MKPAEIIIPISMPIGVELPRVKMLDLGLCSVCGKPIMVAACVVKASKRPITECSWACATGIAEEMEDEAI